MRMYLLNMALIVILSFIINMHYIDLLVQCNSKTVTPFLLDTSDSWGVLTF